MSLLTVFCVSGTRACHILIIEFWILGVGSNWYRYNRGIIFGKCRDSCSPANVAIVEKPNAAPYMNNITISVTHQYHGLHSRNITSSVTEVSILLGCGITWVIGIWHCETAWWPPLQGSLFMKISTPED